MSAAASRFAAERLAGTLPPLLVRAMRIAQTVTPGVHGLRRAGSGDAFWQFRHYQAGDPARMIDWRRSARSDRTFVRENEWEAAQSLWVWRDTSASMHWRSRRELPEKAEQASLIALASAAMLLRAGEQVALIGTGRPPRRGAALLAQLAETLAREEEATEAASGLPPAQVLPRHAQAIFVGDFLAPMEALEAAFRPYAAGAVRGHLVQVLDPAEETLPMRGRVRFEGLEDEGDILIRRVDRVRDIYRTRLADHRAALRAFTRRLGWTFAVHHTDRPPHAALLALYGALSLPG